MQLVSFLANIYSIYGYILINPSLLFVAISCLVIFTDDMHCLIFPFFYVFIFQTHILRESTVRYTEIRSPQQAILCRHAIRFQCSRGGECHFAHSLIERDIWAVMEKEGLTAEDIVTQAQKHISKHGSTNKDAATNIFSEDNDITTFR